MESLSRSTRPFVLKSYFSLAKPGIIWGNAITAIGGFALASKGHFDFWLFLAMLEGLSLIIASACVFNNCIDRELDGKMERTKNRALVQGWIGLKQALIYGVVLGLLGIYILAVLTNFLTLLLALVGLTVYVLAYSFLKYQTVYGTLIGSIAGAMPPVVGYTAVTHRFDLGALILFLMIALWQMPHFYAIAIRRIQDYSAANLPMLPLVKGIRATKIQMIAYTAAFLLVSLMLTFLGYTGMLYFSVVTVLGLTWLVIGLKGLYCKNDQQWARLMFIFSLVIVMSLSLTIPFSLR